MEDHSSKHEVVKAESGNEIKPVAPTSITKCQVFFLSLIAIDLLLFLILGWQYLSTQPALLAYLDFVNGLLGWMLACILGIVALIIVVNKRYTLSDIQEWLCPNCWVQAFIGLVTAILLLIVLVPIFYTSCPYQADTAEATIIQLINAEAEAAEKADISIIQAIFAPDAIIRDALSGEQFKNPMIRYQTVFANVTFTKAIHYEIQSINGVIEDGADFTSGSKGTYITSDGVKGSYDNPPGADQWKIGKNNYGCWVIKEFTFNAGYN